MRSPESDSNQWAKVEWSNDRGWIGVERPSENLVLVEMGGLVDGDHSRKVIEGMDVYFDEPRDLFFDISHIRSYRSEARTVMTKWFLDHMKQLRSLHMYSENPVVKMGISMVNMAIGGKITSYSKEAEFLAALESLKQDPEK